MNTSHASPIALLPAESVVLDARPSPSVVWVWLFTKALPTALAAAFVALIAWMFVDAPAQRGGPRPYPALDGIALVASCFVGALLAAQAYNRLLARTYLYRVTSQRFIFAGGILFKTTHSVEHRRVTDVQFTQNLIEQALSLGCVNLSTPGTVKGGSNGKSRAMPELRLEGLADGAAVFEAVADCVRSSHGPAA